MPCLIELFSRLGMLVFRLPLGKIIEIKAYFYTVRHEIFVQARCHRRKMFLTACVKDMEVLTALLRPQEKARNEKRNCRFSGGVFVGTANFLSRQAFSDESHSFTHNEFHVRSQGPQ